MSETERAMRAELEAMREDLDHARHGWEQAAEEVRRQDAELIALRAQLVDLRRAGRPLSNVAYNLSKKCGHALTEGDCAALDQTWRAWDCAASKALDTTAEPDAAYDAERLAAAQEVGEPVAWMVECPTNGRMLFLDFNRALKYGMVPIGLYTAPEPTK